jgi:hypothetical protein
MPEEKYTYLPPKWKKDFVNLYDYYGDKLEDEHIQDWNTLNNLGLRFYQMDDLLHIQPEILEEWRTL